MRGQVVVGRILDRLRSRRGSRGRRALGRRPDRLDNAGRQLDPDERLGLQTEPATSTACDASPRCCLRLQVDGKRRKRAGAASMTSPDASVRAADTSRQSASCRQTPRSTCRTATADVRSRRPSRAPAHRRLPALDTDSTSRYDPRRSTTCRPAPIPAERSSRFAAGDPASARPACRRARHRRARARCRPTASAGGSRPARRAAMPSGLNRGVEIEVVTVDDDVSARSAPPSGTLTSVVTGSSSRARDPRARRRDGVGGMTARRRRTSPRRVSRLGHPSGLQPIHALIEKLGIVDGAADTT